MLNIYGEQTIRECQIGFRQHKSTIYAINVINQIIKKFYEQNNGQLIVFIDFEQGFDGENRDMLTKGAQISAIPRKIIKFITITFEELKARISAQEGVFNQIVTNLGMKQDQLSATLIHHSSGGVLQT